MSFKKKKDYFKETLKDNLSFSRNERRGLFAVLLVMLLLIVTKLAVDYWPQDIKPTDFSQFDKEVTEFLASKKEGSDSPAYSQSKFLAQSIPREKTSGELFSFNPNGLPAEDWKRLGFSDRQVKVIKNYEAKGGKFYSKVDVRKMYSISEEEYNRIEPYILIPTQSKTYENKYSINHYDDLRIDISTADTTELKKLRGIGSGYANRIVKYRTKLGGFHSIEQLQEVWGLSDSLFELIAPYIYVSDSLNIDRININTVTLTDLKSHPYFNYNLANHFVNYRLQHGNFKDRADIKRLPLVNDELYRKIAPYLKVE